MSYAILPNKSKPSKSASTNKTRPILTHGELRQTDSGGWDLVTCDSYQLAFVRLSVKDGGEDLVPGPISSEALKAIEKTGAFYANGTVRPCDSFGRCTGQTFDREMDIGQFPKWDGLVPETSPEAFSVGLDADLLAQLAQSLGSSGKYRRVKLTFVTDDNGQPNALRPIRVEPFGGIDSFGVLMPIRIDA